MTIGIWPKKREREGIKEEITRDIRRKLPNQRKTQWAKLNKHFYPTYGQEKTTPRKIEITQPTNQKFYGQNSRVRRRCTLKEYKQKRDKHK